jgi:hypothetical protein
MFVVVALSSLHIMFLERKYLSMLCFSVQIVINITKPNVEVRPLKPVINYVACQFIYSFELSKEELELGDSSICFTDNRERKIVIICGDK